MTTDLNVMKKKEIFNAHHYDHHKNNCMEILILMYLTLMLLCKVSKQFLRMDLSVISRECGLSAIPIRIIYNHQTFKSARKINFSYLSSIAKTFCSVSLTSNLLHQSLHFIYWIISKCFGVKYF